MKRQPIVSTNPVTGDIMRRSDLLMEEDIKNYINNNMDDYFKMIERKDPHFNYRIEQLSKVPVFSGEAQVGGFAPVDIEVPVVSSLRPTRRAPRPPRRKRPRKKAPLPSVPSYIPSLPKEEYVSGKRMKEIERDLRKALKEFKYKKYI